MFLFGNKKEKTMVAVKLPMDEKYNDSIGKEVLVVNLTTQGYDLSEYALKDKVFRAIEEKDLDFILVSNPEKIYSKKLIDVLTKGKPEGIGIKEIFTYA